MYEDDSLAVEMETDDRLSVVGRIAGLGDERVFQLELTNTSTSTIVLWEWVLLITGTGEYIDLNMNLPLRPGSTYQWATSVAHIAGWPPVTAATAILGVKVDVEPVEEFPEDLYLPLRDGPIQLFGSEEELRRLKEAQRSGTVHEPPANRFLARFRRWRGSARP